MTFQIGDKVLNYKFKNGVKRNAILRRGVILKLDHERAYCEFDTNKRPSWVFFRYLKLEGTNGLQN